MSYYNHYLESRVLSASPVELIRIAYRGALDATSAARQHFASGDIGARTRSLNQAAALVTELVTSLQPPATPAGQQLEQSLRRLYDYVLYQIAQSAITQSPDPLTPADAILRSLLEGWETVEPTPAAPVESTYSSDSAFSVNA